VSRLDSRAQVGEVSQYREKVLLNPLIITPSTNARRCMMQMQPDARSTCSKSTSKVA